jgi:hypothetical protein
MIWPNGDSAKLRSAAAAWTSAGTNFEVDEILGATGPIGSIGAQQIPEGPAIAAAFAATNRSASGILQQCATVATQLTSLAGKIDTVHAAILDLLSRICNPLTGLKEVWEFLTDDDEDEISKIANDIRIIVNQFTAEVDALCQEIATALSEAAVIISTMARYAEKEWDHFLHDTDAGRVLDHVGQVCKGVFTEAEGLVKGFWTFNLARAVVDPKGFWHSVSGAVDKLESLTGLDGEQRLKESWKELGKDTVHWDEWSTNPFQAAGETLFDGATMLIPGGALEKLPMVSRAAAGSRTEAQRRVAALWADRVENPGRAEAPSRGSQASGRTGKRCRARGAIDTQGRLTRVSRHTIDAPRRCATAWRRTERLPTTVTGTRPSRTGRPCSTVDVRGSFGPKQLHWAGTRVHERRVEDRHIGRISTSLR